MVKMCLQAIVGGVYADNVQIRGFFQIQLFLFSLFPFIVNTYMIQYTVLFKNSFILIFQYYGWKNL